MIQLSPQAFPFLHILQQAIRAGSVSKPGNSTLLNWGSKSFKSILFVEILTSLRLKTREAAKDISV